MKKHLINKIGLIILILVCASGAVFAQNQWEFPIFFTVGQNDNVQVLNRTLQSWNEDFFTFIPSRGALVIMETLGNVDTFMELFDAESGLLLSSDDNSGNSMNARIEFNVQANRRYIIKVKGVGTWSTGNYGFRAYFGTAGNTSNNPWNNPIAYTIGQNVNVAEINRSIHSGSEDFFLLTPYQNGAVIFETTGSTDTFMELYDADTGQLLDSNDDSGAGQNARIEFNVQANRRYIAKVRGFGTWTSGNYGFRAYFGTSNNPWNNPIAYTIGQNANVAEINRSISSGSEDFFLLVPSRNGIVTIETTGSTDTFMELYDADTGQLLDSNDDSGSDRNARIQYDMQANRRYIVKVRGFGTWTTGNYGFKAYSDSFNTLWNNPIAYTIGQNVNAPLVNRSIQSGVEDFFLLVPTSSGQLIIETTGGSDTYMELFDADTGQLLDSDDDSGTGYNARIEFNVQANRRYIAKVRGYSTWTVGSYGFRAYMANSGNAIGGGNPIWNNPTNYTIGQNVNVSAVSRSLSSGSEDFFLLIPNRNGIVVAETTGSTDTFMELYDADTGQLLSSDDDSGSSLNARISYNMQANRRYIAKVRGYRSWITGNYSFRAYFQ